MKATLKLIGMGLLLYIIGLTLFIVSVGMFGSGGQ